MKSQPPQSHRYVIMVIVLTGVLMSVLDGIVVNIALPTITAALHVDLGLSQWSITGYMVTLTALLLFFGRLSNRVGKVPLFVAGFSVFTAASFACGLSSTLTELVVFRVIQAIGGAMVFSISGAILFLAFPPQERGRAMGYLGSTVAVGSILGPILGGFLVDALGWQYIFLINVPIGVVLVTCALIFLKVHEERQPKLSMDWAGAATLAVSLFSLMLLLSQIESAAGSLGVTLILAAVFAASTSGFILRERDGPEAPAGSAPVRQQGLPPPGHRHDAFLRLQLHDQHRGSVLLSRGHGVPPHAGWPCVSHHSGCHGCRLPGQRLAV